MLLILNEKKEIGRGKNHPCDRQNLVNNLKNILFRQQKTGEQELVDVK